MEGIVVLTSIVEEEGDQFVSYCTELETASCGDSIEEAFANLEEAIVVHLNALEETGERERVFRERNIEVLKEPHSMTAALTIPVGKLVKATQHEIPVLA